MNGRPTSIIFYHPGAEFRPNFSEIKNNATDWSTIKHSRKFVESKGSYLSSLNASPKVDVLGLWAEWEAPSKIRKMFTSVSGLPKYIHTPIRPTQPIFRNFLNTDPCVFGDYFLYSNCQQYTCQGRQTTILQNLEPGDAIFFGSNSRNYFVLDTVFVIREVLSIDRRQIRNKTIPQVPLWYYDLTLDFLMLKYKLYIGASITQPINGMFSFFPSLIMQQSPMGFSRPSVFNQYNKGQSRGFRYKGLDAPQFLWNQVVQETLKARLMLGVKAEAP